MISNGVIVAENDTLMRSVIRSVLLRADLQVFPAANGMEAVAIARQFIARLVLLDIAMPHLNGLLACEAIHRLPGYDRVPIMMLTAYDDDRIRVAARRLGAVGFITKPFRPDRLLARIAAHVDVPADLLRTVVASSEAGDMPGARAQVWAAPAEPDWLRKAAPKEARMQVWGSPRQSRLGADEPETAANGRETVRILRGAERGA